MARIIFAGSPDFVLPYLRWLADSEHELVAVYTQPDRPRGRGQKVQHSAIKSWALQQQIPVEQPIDFKDPATQSRMAYYAPDLLLVVAYGILLPLSILKLPGHGCLNVHYSLLPRWRGAAPVIHALMADDDKTGVCLMQMDQGLDTGPLYVSEALGIDPQLDAAELTMQLTELGVNLLQTHLANILQNQLLPQPQAASGACYAAKIKKNMACIDWQQSAGQIASNIRAFKPWPVAFTYWKTMRLRIWQAKPITLTHIAEPLLNKVNTAGYINNLSTDAIDVICGGETGLRISELQPAGGRRQSARDFINAQQQLAAEIACGHAYFTHDHQHSTMPGKAHTDD